MYDFKNVKLLLIAVVTATMLVPSQALSATLYDDLGQKPGITKVLVDAVGFVSDDARINKFFAGANIPQFEGVLVDLVCTVTGGPCNYTGKGNPIPLTKEADFNAFVEDLEKSLDKNQVPITTQNRLLRLLAPLSPAASE